MPNACSLEDPESPLMLNPKLEAFCRHACLPLFVPAPPEKKSIIKQQKNTHTHTQSTHTHTLLVQAAASAAAGDVDDTPVPSREQLLSSRIK